MTPCSWWRSLCQLAESALHHRLQRLYHRQQQQLPSLSVSPLPLSIGCLPDISSSFMDSPQSMYAEQQAAFLPEGRAAAASASYPSCCDGCYGCGNCDGCIQGCRGCCPGTPCCGAPCCAQPPCCQPGACCAPGGSSPCFCTPLTAAFSAAICLLLLSFALLVSALCDQTLFKSSDHDVRIGAFTICRRWTDCKRLSYSEILQAGNLDMFQSFRATAIIAGVTGLAAAILAAVRLSKQQRGKPISARLDRCVLGSACVSLACCAASFTLLSLIADGFRFSALMSYGRAEWASGRHLLLSALVISAVAFILHCISLVAYRWTRKTAAAVLESEAASPQLLQLLQLQHLARLQLSGPAYYPAHAHPAYAPPSHQQLSYLASLPFAPPAHFNPAVPALHPSASIPGGVVPAPQVHYPVATDSGESFPSSTRSTRGGAAASISSAV